MHSGDILFAYLRDIIYDPAHASLDTTELDEEFLKLAQGLEYFAKLYAEQTKLVESLANGDLSIELPPPSNKLAAPLKSLHASLKHITWQSQQVAKGDYKQRIDFMGEFANAFNTMIEQLDNREQALNREMEVNREKTAALEQSNKLLTMITHNVPQMIFVVDENDREVLYSNRSATDKLVMQENFLDAVFEALKEDEQFSGVDESIEFVFESELTTNVYQFYTFPIQWENRNALAFSIEDVTSQKEAVHELEEYAYHDSLTSSHNRHAGMQVFRRWLEEQRAFTLCFIDLDNLKYINDTFGHSQGDLFIIRGAESLHTMSDDCVVARLGGDEFMLLCPKMSEQQVMANMQNIEQLLQDSSRDLPYDYDMSYGAIEIGTDNDLPASLLLSMADEKMYEMKRKKKEEKKDDAWRD